MNTIKKLYRYYATLRKWKENQQIRLTSKEPTPQDYDLKTETELFLARKMAQEVEQKVTKETKR